MNLTFNDWAASHRWAILPEMMKSILKSIIPSDQDSFKPEALYTSDGDIPQWSYRTEVFGSVAVIPVIGAIYSKGSYYYGGTPVSLIAKDFTSAINDPAISAIVLNINSPGGEITGVSDLANVIYQARGTKPIISYIYGMGASAAYWIGSAADKVVISDTGEAGSIGVVSVYLDTKEYDKKFGIKEIEIVSSQSPRKRIDPSEPDGRAEVQKIVDELADVFIKAVALHRNVSTDTVIDNFGQGGVLVGQSAVAAGLADENGSLDSIIKSLNVNNNTSNGGIFMDVNELLAKHADTYNAVLALGKKQGQEESAQTAKTNTDSAVAGAVAKENERITGILTLSNHPGSKKIIEAAIKDQAATKETVALQILEAQKGGDFEAFKAAMDEDNTSLVGNLKKIKTDAPNKTTLTEEQLGKQIAAMANGMPPEETK